MKTGILLAFLIISYSQLNAQNLYPILMEAYKCVNEYDYNSRSDINERLNISLKPNKSKKKECKIISDALETADFAFDNVNDTLLLDVVYDDYIVGGGPRFIYAESSKAVKIMDIDSYKESTYKELTASEKWDSSYYPMMYSGDVIAFRELFMKIGGKSLGCYAVALRVIIKEGEVVYPSMLWNYGCLLNTAE